jgi:flagellar basal-body rod protein FlgB
MKIFDSTFALSEKTLALRSQRMEILSRNIANADTPNYKAQDLDFRRVLSSTQTNAELKATHAGHINRSDSFSGADLVYTVPFNSSVDGNTVEMSVEQAKYGKAAADYQATLRFLEGEMSGIRKALRGE